ncbi:MAG: hypothetical protein NC182_06525 [Prevotella sp.]|nr:hypothetical protein [Prevotella sp.]
MQMIEIVGLVCFCLGFVLALIDAIGHKYTRGANYSSKTMGNLLQFGENTKKYRHNRRFVGCSFFGILRFSLHIVFLIIFSDFQWGYLIFIPVLIYLLIGSIYMTFSICLFKKDKLIVRSDHLFKVHQAQKKCVIRYMDIKDINIITVRFKNTQGGDIVLNEREGPLRNRRGIIKEKPSYYRQYSSLDLDIICIYLKNSSHLEGIVLNLYTPQQKEFIFNELKRRIQVTN